MLKSRGVCNYPWGAGSRGKQVLMGHKEDIVTKINLR